MEVVVFAPVLPAWSVKPVPLRVIRLAAAVTPAVGVRVAVQVIPPSADTRLLSVPLATVKSDRVRPFTASLKVMVTVLVSPTARAVSATVMVTVGRWVSMA
ncbi:hypothetical protein D9M68_967820 [compost metagenome]